MMMNGDELKGGCPSQARLLKLSEGGVVVSSVLVLRDGSCLHLTHVVADADGIAAHCHSFQELCEARAKGAEAE